MPLPTDINRVISSFLDDKSKQSYSDYSIDALIDQWETWGQYYYEYENKKDYDPGEQEGDFVPVAWYPHKCKRHKPMCLGKAWSKMCEECKKFEENYYNNLWEEEYNEYNNYLWDVYYEY